jgi:hypothetical protein
VTSAVQEALPTPLERPSERKRVVLSLGRTESRRLLRHPVFLVGVTLSVVLLAINHDVSPANVGEHWNSTSIGAAYMDLCGNALIFLALATLVTSNLAALRSRRDHTEETYHSLPADARARTAAQLLAVAWPVAIGAVLIAADFVYTGAAGGLYVDYSGRTAVPSGFELAQGPLVVLVLGVLGVALAAWVPRFSVTLMVAFAVFATEWVFVDSIGSRRSLHWLVPLADPAKYTRAGAHFPPNHPPEDGLAGFDTTGAGWHLLYLVALAAVLAGLALLRHRSRRRVLAACGIALAVLVAAALPQLLA